MNAPSPLFTQDAPVQTEKPFCYASQLNGKDRHRKHESGTSAIAMSLLYICSLPYEPVIKQVKPCE